MKTLPWSTETYKPLEPGDLLPHPPTPEQRIRVAAALATWMRDGNMTGVGGPINAEVIRTILIASDEVWARDIVGIAELDLSYDAEDPKVRFEQTVARLGR